MGSIAEVARRHELSGDLVRKWLSRHKARVANLREPEASMMSLRKSEIEPQVLGIKPVSR